MLWLWPLSCDWQQGRHTCMGGPMDQNKREPSIHSNAKWLYQLWLVLGCHDGLHQVSIASMHITFRCMHVCLILLQCWQRSPDPGFVGGLLLTRFCRHESGKPAADCHLSYMHECACGWSHWVMFCRLFMVLCPSLWSLHRSPQLSVP